MNTHYVFAAPTGTHIYQNNNGKQMPTGQVMTQKPESLKTQGKFPRRGVSSFFVERRRGSLLDSPKRACRQDRAELGRTPHCTQLTISLVGRVLGPRGQQVWCPVGCPLLELVEKK